MAREETVGFERGALGSRPLISTAQIRSGLGLFFKTRYSKVGAILIAGVVLLVLIGTVAVPYNPNVTSGARNSPPSLAHPFGTDFQGHDLLSQIVWGAFPSLFVTLIAAIDATILAIVIGINAGYYDKLNSLLGGTTDIILSIPSIPLLLILLSIYWPPTNVTYVLVLSLVLWAPGARAIRAQVMALKKLPYVDAAKLSGMRDSAIVYKTMARQAVPLGIAYFIVNISLGLVLVTALEFLGIGNPDAISWGNILYWSQSLGLVTGDWWWPLAPGLMISIFSTGAALLGFSAERTLNPRMHLGEKI
jgi:peptide/nickel transport system permease protein